MDPHFLSEQGRERRLQDALHGAEPGLRLPAAKVRAVVGELEREDQMV
jgi:hypothetical protein